MGGDQDETAAILAARSDGPRLPQDAGKRAEPGGVLARGAARTCCEALDGVPTHACCHREFVADDWRGREADLLFEIPYRQPNGDARARSACSIEHQTRTDVMMPFRTLSLAVSFWDRQWARLAGRWPRPGRNWLHAGDTDRALHRPDAVGQHARMADLLAEPAWCFTLSHQHSEHVILEPWPGPHRRRSCSSRGNGWAAQLAGRNHAVNGPIADAFRQVTLTCRPTIEAIHAADRPCWQELIQALLSMGVHQHWPQAETHQACKWMLRHY